jgi:hypothetical protein
MVERLSGILLLLSLIDIVRRSKSAFISDVTPHTQSATRSASPSTLVGPVHGRVCYVCAVYGKRIMERQVILDGNFRGAGSRRTLYLIILGLKISIP